ncbi:HD domain-containing phosphohydrolase [Selenomonas sp. AB3002]|uniref:HD domain-containing phosphohydrolase n=1 Tax=Selenomonas sp. AB3002 TaxID=1392502 RepID=UPI00068A7EE2
MEFKQATLYGEKKPHILVIDDDEVIRGLIKNNLNDLAHVDTVISGEDGLSYLKSGRETALILLDYLMHGMTGLEFLKHMKSMTALEDIPVLMLTGEEDGSLELQALEAGAVDFIHKPVAVAVMRQRVLNILNYTYLQHSLQDEVERQTKLADKRKEEAEQLFEEMIMALAQAIDAKDHYTHGHSQRVAEYSAQLSYLLGDDPKQVRQIYYMGLLHDIGKIGIPVEIINKPGNLTDEEYAIIKSHSVIGAEVLKPIRISPELMIGARHHHERFDGHGYPDKLSGNDIPRAARIIAVVDAYDAMTSNRSYRKGLTTEKVYNEIARNSGSQFDPEFAGIMLEYLRKEKDSIKESVQEVNN